MAEASGGPKPKQGTKRAQWETHGDREGRVALPWLKTDPATDDGGKSCEKGVQIQNKTRRAEESGAAVKRSLPTDGAAKRPRRIATPATAVKRPSTLTSSSDRNQSKRLRARSDAGRASTNKAPSNKTGLVRPPPSHGRPPPDKLIKRARTLRSPSDSKRRESKTMTPIAESSA